MWLDYPLWVSLWHLLKRIVHRVSAKEILWQGNTESIRSQFLSRESLFLWAIKTRGAGIGASAKPSRSRSTGT